MQVPGVNYMEKFAPVAHDATTRLVICITLKYHRNGWRCQSIDIEAAFLEGPIGVPMYMEWPPGLVELGYVTESNRKSTCIRMLKCIYRNVDAALCFYKLYAHNLMKMGFIQSKADPCLFILKDAQGKLLMLASCHVDDTQIAGPEDELEKFKEKLRK